MKYLFRGLGVLCGIATGCAFWLTLFLDGSGKESPWCERNCEPPVYAPSWIAYLFVSGFIYVALTLLVGYWADKRKQTPKYAILLHETEEAFGSLVMGGIAGVVGTPLLAALGIAALVAYALITQW